MYAARKKVSCLMFLFVSVAISEAYYGTDELCDNTTKATTLSRQFAFSLYNTASRLRGLRRNVLLSPLAVGSLLSMVSHGAWGRTKNELLKVLKQGEEIEDCLLQAYFADRFNDYFILKDTPLHNTARLRTATRIFGDSNLTFDADFVKHTGLYGMEIAAVPISTATRRAERQINKWVYKQTNGNVKQIIKPKYLRNDAKIVATCSIFFKGTWMSGFHKASRERFFIFNKRWRPTNFMTSRKPVKHISSSTLRADLVEIPYDVPDGSNIDASLILVMPHVRGTTIRRVELGLQDKILQNLLYGNTSQEVKIRIPKFLFVGSMKLKLFLKRMGIREVFIPHRSKLHRTLTPDRRSNDNVYISLTEHKVRFEVNEYGTQGNVPQTAVPAAKDAVISSPNDKILKYNRPYLFILYDKFTNTIVYIGRVSNPNRRL